MCGKPWSGIRYFFLLLLLQTFLFPGVGQSNLPFSEGRFNYIHKTTTGQDSPQGSRSGSQTIPDYKYNVARGVFEALVTAKGNFSLQRPEFVMTQSEVFVAWMDPGRVMIGLEEKAYDICTTFGPDSLNALAAILSHELTHYYEKHDWESPLGLAAGEQANARAEEEADYLGGFLAFAAGYQSVGVIPQFLTKVYQEYGLPADLEGYPPFLARLALAERSLESSRCLVYIFEAAKYRIVLGEYEEASYYFQNILKDFQSREIYNKAGVNLVLSAMTLFSRKELQFAYPFEWDAETRVADPEIYSMFRTSRSTEEDRIQRRTRMLKEAIQLFDQAAALDKKYSTALLNKAGALSLLQDSRASSYWAEEALQSAQELGLNKFCFLYWLVFYQKSSS